MKEIEKLYENAGIERDKGNCSTCFLDIQTCVRSYDECPYHYPPFTAEKQIELIKWLAEHKNDFGLFYSMNYRTNKNEWWACCDKKYEDFTEAHHDTNFEQALTGLINSLWEHLSPEEKEQIRDILAR